MGHLVYGPFVTREIALERGYKRYYVNQPCLRGHVAPRSTQTRNCSRCECDRKRKDTTVPLKPRSRTLSPEELSIRARLRQLKVPNFSYWAKQGVFVYCYLSKKLKPYYVGVASDRTRPIAPHSFPVPKDRRLIRIMKSALTWDEATEWERRYIAHYGRVDQGTGCLWNLTDGGEGVPGRVVSEETKAAIAEKAAERSREVAERYSIPFNFYLSLDHQRRKALTAWLDRHPGENYEVYFDDQARSKIEKEGYQRRGEIRARNVANKRGVPEEVWLKWSRKDRIRFSAWIDSGSDRTYEGYLRRHHGPHHAAGTSQSQEHVAKRMLPRLERTAEQLGIPVEWWIHASEQQRSVLRSRYNRGERDPQALMANLDLVGVNPRSVEAAKRFDVSLEWW